jgi:hypothetical protein
MSRVLIVSRALIGTAVAVLATGCQCNPPGFRPNGTATDPVVDPAPAGGFGSWLSMDAAADTTQLTIAYYDLPVGAVGFAVGLPGQNGTVSWAHEQVEGYPQPSGIDTVDVGKYASHRTAPDGTTWLAYQDVRNGRLRVVQRTGSRTWAPPVEVDEGGEWIDLAIGADGNPVVVHCDPDSSEVRLARFDGARWLSTTLYKGAGGVSHSRVLVDGGLTTVAFRDDSLSGLVLVEGTEVTILDVEGDVGAWPSLLADGQELLIAYHDVGNQDLRLATRGPERDWTFEVVDDGELRGADTEMFLDEGQLGILYFDGMDNDLLLARRGPEGFTIEQVGVNGAMGYHNEIAFAASHWWAGTFDQTARTLFVRAL